MSSNAWKAVAAAAALIVMTSSSTSTSALFVAYQTRWGLTPADIGLAFSVYVGSLIPVLLLFGGFPERFGRPPIVLAGMLFMAAGTLTLVFAHGLPLLIGARLLQGIGAALAIGAISATFTENYKGRIAAGQALAIAQALALACGPIVTAIAYDLGGGPNLSYLPMLVLGIAILAFVPFFGTQSDPVPQLQPTEEPLPARDVWRGLRFAMPVIFVSWAGNSLYLSLVPAYISASLHASDALIGAGAFFATQLSAVLASTYFGNVSAERNGVVGPSVVVFGLALLVVGTYANLWALIVVATILVGAGSGVASGAAYATAARVGRGQRARIFARLLVAAYLGYSVPSLVIGFIATRSSFTIGFSTAIVGLAVIAVATPFLKDGSRREGRQRPPAFAMCQHGDP